MKMLVIGLEGVSLMDLLSDERLENLRRMAEIGYYAFFDSSAAQDADHLWTGISTGSANAGDKSGMHIWDRLKADGERSVIINAPPFRGQAVSIGEQVKVLSEFSATGIERSESELFATVFAEISRPDWSYFLVVDGDPKRHENAESKGDYLPQFDNHFRKILETLDDQTVLTVVALSPRASGNGFMMAAVSNPLNGEVEGAKIEDVLPTMLSLAGYEMPPNLSGTSLVAQALLSNDNTNLSEDEEAKLREQLSGLGYFG